MESQRAHQINYSSTMSATDVRKQAKDRSLNILRDFRYLKQILERHEATIQKRWRKKTQSQRLKILLAAWGGPMSRTHRPDFEAFRKDSQREVGTYWREAYMWPYINQEDLTKPRSLLLLLNTRAHHPPAGFAAADLRTMHLGLMSQALTSITLHDHVILLCDPAESGTYGHLLHRNDDLDTFRRLWLRKEYQPGDGLLILEVQERLLSFLLGCVKQVMSDISEEMLTQGPIQPTTSVVSEFESGVTSLAAAAAEAPYCIPSHINLESIEASLLAKRDDAMDHLWSLREDPGYFNFSMRDCAEHRPEMVKDISGQSHPAIRRNNASFFWGSVLRDGISTAYMMAEMWSKLHGQAIKLKQMQPRYNGVIRTEDDLPPDYLDALLKFKFCLQQCAESSMKRLEYAIIASPPWRSLFETDRVLDVTQTIMNPRRKRGTKLNEAQHQLLWLLQLLWENGPELSYLGMMTVMDELHFLLGNNAQARSMMTSYHYDVVADLSTIAQFLGQLDAYQTWAHELGDSTDKRSEAIIDSFQCEMMTLAQFLSAVEVEGIEKILARYGAPNEVNFHYPIEQRATRENVDAMRSAEANLDKFWRIFDIITHGRVASLKDTAIHNFLTGPRVLQRTPEWQEPCRSKTDKSKSDVQMIHKPLSEIYYELQRRTESTIEDSKRSASPRTKIKTRKANTDEQDTIEAQTVPESDNINDQSEVTVDVDKRALKVFKTLFFTPSLTATPGETAWTDFLHAMISVGFEPKKLHGSMWQFASKASNSRRNIIFHEPHPSGKIPYVVARRHGRRLNRVYGWSSGTFVLSTAGTRDVATES